MDEMLSGLEGHAEFDGRVLAGITHLVQTDGLTDKAKLIAAIRGDEGGRNEDTRTRDPESAGAAQPEA